MIVRKATIDDVAQIRDIYNHYVRETIITFDLTEKEEGVFKKEFQDIQSKFPFLVGEVDNEIVGYAYVSTWKTRPAYDYAVESSVYLHPQKTGKGYGKNLYKALFEAIEGMRIHTVIAGISLPNETSIALHEYFGFKKIAHFREVGYKFNQWIDVGYWQLLRDLDPRKTL